MLTVTLVVTGATGGIGSGRWALEVPEVVTDEGVVASVQVVHGVMTWRRAVLLADDGRVETLVALRSGEPECAELRSARLVTERTQHVLVDPEQAPAIAGSVGPDSAPVTLYRCTSGDASATLALGRGSALPEDWSAFEYRLSLAVDLVVGDGTERVHVIGVPLGDAARRVTAISDVLAEVPSALFVDAGSFVDGTSAVLDGALSLHRPTGFDVLRRLDPAALAPGRSELVAGGVSFVAEAGDLPYIATNWVAGEGAPTLPASRIVDVDGVEVAFLAVVDPAVAIQVPELAVEGVTLTDPETSLRRALSELRADVVVVLVSGGPELVRLVQGIEGVDVVAGDPGPRIERLGRVQVALRPPRAATGPAPITVPLDGVVRLDVSVREGRPTAAVLQGARLDPDIAPDPEVLERINRVRDASYPALDRPLLPALDRDAWSDVVCQAVLEATGADVALLPALPVSLELPGPLTELLVLDRLAMLDRLEIHEVGGDLLPRLLDKAFEGVPTSCGAPLGARSPLVGGRAVDAQRVYLVATTDRLMATTALQSAVSEARSSRLLDQPVVRDPDLTLRAAVLEVLRRHRDDTPEVDVVQELVGRSEADLEPLWLLRSARGSVGVSSFQGVDDARYEAIPETLATSPSSLTVTADLDLALEYSSRRFAWDLRNRTLFTRLDTVDGRTEPADDLRVSTAGSLPGAALPLGWSWIPYSELLLDSEVTATEAEDGSLNPRQADLSLTVGLSTASGALTRLRVGAFVLRDLSVPDKAFEPGGRLEASTSVALGPGLAWTSTLDGFLFADSPGQDASDLRYKLLVDTRLELPLARWLSAGPYAQGFLFQGRVAETSTPAASWTVGAALDVAGAFRL